MPLQNICSGIFLAIIHQMASYKPDVCTRNRLPVFWRSHSPPISGEG